MAIGEIDSSKGQAACDTLLQGINRLQAVYESYGSTFNSLAQVNPDLGTMFINQLNGSIGDIYVFLAEHIYPAATTYFQNDIEVPVEEEPAEEQPKDEGPGDSGPGDSGPGSSGPGSSGPGPSEPPVEDPGETQPINTGSLTGMTLDQLDGFTGEVIGLADKHKKYLDEYLEDDQYSDEIKDAILNSPYIPQEFKDQIKDMDSKAVRQVIEDMFKGEYPEVFELNPLNLGIVYRYLENVAKENGITLEQLLSDPQYAELLKTTLADFKNIVELVKGWENLSSEEFQANLLKLYDGNETADLPKSDVPMVRALVDYLSEQVGVKYDELLTDTSYADTLKEATEQFAKTATFFEATSHFTEKGMRDNVSHLYDGTNNKALGMDENNVNTFKGEMDSLAKSNSTTTDKLLSDKTYAETVKESMQKSETTSSIGAIFKNADATVSQKVAKNLYNTKFETKAAANGAVASGDVAIA